MLLFVLILLNIQLVLSDLVLERKKKTAAILLTGHARTFAFTSHSLQENLIKANSLDFWLFAFTYRTRDSRRGSDKTNHTASHGGPIAKEEIYDVYKSIVPNDHLFVYVIKDAVMKAEMPSVLRKQMNPKAPYRIKHRFRLSMIFRMIANAYQYMHKIERERNQLFNVVIKLRFDLIFLNPFIIRLDFCCAGSEIKPPYTIVVPKNFTSGSSHLSPKQIKTRPCDSQGSLRPTWVQDHMAYGTSLAMALYANGTDQYMRLHAASFFSPSLHNAEVILANVLKTYSISVKCDPAIKYTILR